MPLPLSVAPSFFLGHRACCHGIAIAVRELNDDAKQVSTGGRLPKNVVYGIVTFGFRALHERSSKAGFFDLFGSDAMTGNVLDPIFRPDKCTDSHESHPNCS